MSRTRDYACFPIPPSEFVAWREATGNIVYPGEYAILRAMDAAYCRVMSDELKALYDRQQEAAGKPGGNKR